MEMKDVRIVGHIVFSDGDPDLSDPDAAEFALRRAGYMVARLPDRLRHRIKIPGDDFMQAFMDAVITDEWKVTCAIMDELNAIVHGYGGVCMECGAEPPDYEPAFDELFELLPPRH